MTAPLEGPRRRGPLPAVRNAMVLAFLLHTGAVLWVWARWEAGVRGGWVVWMDLPVSLAFYRVQGGLFLVASLVLGGLWWAALGGALSWLVGLGARRR